MLSHFSCALLLQRRPDCHLTDCLFISSLVFERFLIRLGPKDYHSRYEHSGCCPCSFPCVTPVLVQPDPTVLAVHGVSCHLLTTSFIRIWCQSSTAGVLYILFRPDLHGFGVLLTRRPFNFRSTPTFLLCSNSLRLVFSTSTLGLVLDTRQTPPLIWLLIHSTLRFQGAVTGKKQSHPIKVTASFFQISDHHIRQSPH